jgi:hypothetical protein
VPIVAAVRHLLCLLQVFARHMLQSHKFFHGSCVDTYRNGSYLCKYQPTISGPYILNVTLDDSNRVTVPTAHISGSPFYPEISFGSLSPANCVAAGAGIHVRLLFSVFFAVTMKSRCVNGCVLRFSERADWFSCHL